METKVVRKRGTPSMIPITDDDIIEEVSEHRVTLVIRGDHDFRRSYYGDLIIGSTNLRGALPKEQLLKIIPAGIGLLAVTFTSKRILVTPHKDLYIDGLFISAHSTVGIEPGSPHILDLVDLHLTLEMRVN